MKKIRQHTISVLLVLTATTVPLFMTLLHHASTARHLDAARQDIASLQQQLRLARQQRCENDYVWQGGQDYPATVFSGEIDRTYRVHTPKDYTPDVRYPVVIVFDGMDGTSQRAETESGFNNVPALTVYPDALIGTRGVTAWQGAPYSPVGVNDVQFVDDLLINLGENYCIDTDRIYLVGMSNGAGFAHLAACQMSGRIAGVAGISGAYYQSCSQIPAHRVIYIHSTDDARVPYHGSFQRKLPSIYNQALSEGRTAECRQVIRAAGTRIERYDWGSCNNNYRISLVVPSHQPHGWLQVSDQTLRPDGVLFSRTTSDIIWEFFTESL